MSKLQTKLLQGNEYYAGSFYKDAYNGLGFYKNDSIFGTKWSYEGSFFSNTKNGYGQLSLPDNTYFEVRPKYVTSNNINH